MITLWTDILRAFLTPIKTQFDLPPAPEPPFDGRMFGWQRTRGGVRAAMPVVIWDIKVGGVKEYVGQLHVLKASEYGDDLSTLAARYPCPPIKDEQ